MKSLTDDGTSQSDVPAKVDVTSDSQVVKLNDLGDLLEALLELLDLLFISQPSEVLSYQVTHTFLK